MMQKPVMLILLLLFLLFGCTPAGVEPVIVEEDVQPEETPIPTTEIIEMEETPMTEQPTEEPTIEPVPEEDEVEELHPLTPERVGREALAATPAPGVPQPASPLVQNVKLDLSERLNVEVGEIEVVTVEEVTWPDSSLGCPQPGMSYLQVLTPGFRVVLAAEGKQYAYHSRDANYFILCQQGGLQVPPFEVEK